MINYTEKIPNNVDLGRDRVLQRALEHWQPAYMGWWYDMGPDESHNYEVYLRTAISVEPDGWAQFGYRYSLDYLPMLAVLAASGMGERPGVRAWAAVALSVLVAMWGPLFFFDTPAEGVLGVDWGLP